MQLQNRKEVEDDRVGCASSGANDNRLVQPRVAVITALEAWRTSKVILRRIVADDAVTDSMIPNKDQCSIIGTDDISRIQVARAVRSNDLIVHTPRQDFAANASIKPAGIDLHHATLADRSSAKTDRRSYADGCAGDAF